MDKEFTRQFTKCPCCGSEDRFLEKLGDELKERGLTRDDWKFHLDVRKGVVLDKTKEASIPVGSEVPEYGLITDICMDCGCLYAVNISRSNVKKSIAPTQQLPPQNRSQRRRGQKSGQSPFSLS